MIFSRENCIRDHGSDCKDQTELFTLSSWIGGKLAVQVNLSFCLRDIEKEEERQREIEIRERKTFIHSRSFPDDRNQKRVWSTRITEQRGVTNKVLYHQDTTLCINTRCLHKCKYLKNLIYSNNLRKKWKPSVVGSLKFSIPHSIGTGVIYLIMPIFYNREYELIIYFPINS